MLRFLRIAHPSNVMLSLSHLRSASRVFAGCSAQLSDISFEEAHPAYTIRPPTTVATTFPVICQLSNGVFFDFERDLAASNVHFFFGSKTVTSATEPRASEPRPRRSKHRAGPAVKSSTMRESGIRFSRCKRVTANPRAVSSPVMPNAARSNSISFS